MCAYFVHTYICMCIYKFLNFIKVESHTAVTLLLKKINKKFWHKNPETVVAPGEALSSWEMGVKEQLPFHHKVFHSIRIL